MGIWRSSRVSIVTALIAMFLILASCGGSEPAADTNVNQPVESTTADTATPETTEVTAGTTDTMPVPAGFPAPFMAGGTVVSEAPNEILVTYPAESYDALIDFYQAWSLGQSHRLIDFAPAYEWEFPDFSIYLQPEGGGNLVAITLSP